MVLIFLLGALMTGFDDDVELKELNFRLGKEIAGLHFESRQEYKVDGAGYSVRYANKMCKVDLFVYDGNLSNISDGNASKEVDEERKKACSELPKAQKKGLYKNVNRMNGDLPLSKEIREKFTVDGFTFDISGGACKSYVLVTGFKKHFIKIRVTQYVVDGKSNDKEILDFLAEIVRQIDINSNN